eukprot:3933440-Rhodomonas_salina.1
MLRNLFQHDGFTSLLHTYALDAINISKLRRVSKQIRNYIDNEPLITSFMAAIPADRQAWILELYRIENDRLNIPTPTIQRWLHEGNREYVLDWIIDVVEELEIPAYTMHAGVAIMDRCSTVVPDHQLQVMAISALKIASDLQINEYWFELGTSENVMLPTEAARWASNYAFPTSVHTQIETVLNNGVDWDTFGTFPGQWIWRIRGILEHNSISVPKETELFANYLVDLFYCQIRYDTFQPTAIALASFCCGMLARELHVPFRFLCWLVRCDGMKVVSIMSIMRRLHFNDWENREKIITIVGGAQRTIRSVRSRYASMERMFVGVLPSFQSIPTRMRTCKIDAYADL